jgi:hypothetical protein
MYTELIALSCLFIYCLENPRFVVKNLFFGYSVFYFSIPPKYQNVLSKISYFILIRKKIY